MLVSAAATRAILQGLGALGFDAEAMRREAGIDPEALGRLDGTIGGEAMERLWANALTRAGREELPAEVGLAVPYGAFGALDYLAGTSADVAAGCEALARDFCQVSRHFSLEVEADDEGGGLLGVAWSPRALTGATSTARDVGDEFTLAVCVGHFRAGVGGEFRVQAVRLTRPRPVGPTRHQELFGAPVTFGCAVSTLQIPKESWTQPLRRRDPLLQETLRQLSAHLALGAVEGDLLSAVRGALRRLLPGGDGDPATVARALGTSERSLQRRLQEAGTSYKRLLDAFREAEAERLLMAGAPLAEVALKLGFSDQTTWNRAFRRWKGMAPRAWLASRRGPASPPPRS